MEIPSSSDYDALVALCCPAARFNPTNDEDSVVTEADISIAATSAPLPPSSNAVDSQPPVSQGAGSGGSILDVAAKAAAMAVLANTHLINQSSQAAPHPQQSPHPRPKPQPAAVPQSSGSWRGAGGQSITTPMPAAFPSSSHRSSSLPQFQQQQQQQELGSFTPGLTPTPTTSTQAVMFSTENRAQAPSALFNNPVRPGQPTFPITVGGPPPFNMNVRTGYGIDPNVVPSHSSPALPLQLQPAPPPAASQQLQPSVKPPASKNIKTDVLASIIGTKRLMDQQQQQPSQAPPYTTQLQGKLSSTPPHPTPPHPTPPLLSSAPQFGTNMGLPQPRMEAPPMVAPAPLPVDPKPSAATTSGAAAGSDPDRGSATVVGVPDDEGQVKYFLVYAQPLPGPVAELPATPTGPTSAAASPPPQPPHNPTQLPSNVNVFPGASAAVASAKLPAAPPHPTHVNTQAQQQLSAFAAHPTLVGGPFNPAGVSIATPVSSSSPFPPSSRQPMSFPFPPSPNPLPLTQPSVNNQAAFFSAPLANVVSSPQPTSMGVPSFDPASAGEPQPTQHKKQPIQKVQKIQPIPTSGANTPQQQQAGPSQDPNRRSVRQLTAVNRSMMPDCLKHIFPPAPKAIPQHLFDCAIFVITADPSTRTSYGVGWAVLNHLWKITRADFDAAALESLKTKEPKQQEAILLLMASMDLCDVVNLSAFLITLITQHEQRRHICIRFLLGLCEDHERCLSFHPINSKGWDSLRDRWNVTYMDMDYAVLSNLAKRSVSERESILKMLAGMSLKSIDNMSAFACTAIRKFDASKKSNR